MINQTSSGIEVLGDISWGTHLSQFYETKQDLLEILVPYIKTGLENNEFCLCAVSSIGHVTAEDLKIALAQTVVDFDRLLTNRAIEIVNETEWYLKEDNFDPALVIDAFRDKYKQALGNGYTGMRASGDTFWMRDKHWNAFNAYEKRLDHFVIGKRITILCAYSLDQSGAGEILDVVDTHQFTIARRKGRWEMIEAAVQMQAEDEIKRLNGKFSHDREIKPKLVQEVWGYGTAVLSVGAALSTLLLLRANLKDNPPVVSIFFCAVIFTTRFGGVKPGIFSILLSALGLDYYFLPPINSFAIDATHLPRLLFFMAPSFFIVWLSAAQSNMTKSLNRARNVLEKTVQKLKQTNIALQEEIIERKQAEETLRKNEDRIRLTVDTIPIMAWTTNSDGEVDFLNRRWIDYSGLALDRYIKDPTAPIHPDDVGGVLKSWQVKMAAKKPYDHEMRLRRADGVYRWFLVRTAPLFDDQGSLVKWYGVSIDIEDSKQLSCALLESDQRYRSLFDNMTEGVAYFRMLFKDDQLQDAIYLDVNQAWDNLSGLKNVVGRKLSEVIPGAVESKSPFIEKAAHVALTGQSARFETYSFYLKKWVSVSAYCPQKEHVIVVMDDITERKQAEDELQAAYRRLSYHVENTPLAVIEFDKDLFIKRWSRRAEEIFGWQAAEALGKNVYDADFRIIYKEDMPAVDTINEELTQGTVNSNLSANRNYTKDGNVIYCEWYNSVLKDEHGNVLTILSLVHDVTERNKSEEKLRQVNEELHSLSSHLQNVREVERTAIAREIHDELGQQLTGLKIDALWVEKRIANEDKAVREKISDMIALIDETVKSVRRISTELRPSVLDDLGLIAALEWQTLEFQKRTGIESIFSANSDDLNIDVNLSTTIFRVYQEALTNVTRHAKATIVETIFEETAGYATLTVKDNGLGFDVNSIQNKNSFGLIGMKERAMMFHGELIIESSKTNGTVIILRVPLIVKNNLQV